jgi:hypothetical protein
MTYKRRTSASQHSEGSKQKHRKSGDEYDDSEIAGSSKNTEGKYSYY